MCNNNNSNSTSKEVKNKTTAEMQEIKKPSNPIMTMVRACVILNIFTIGINLPKIFKITPEFIKKQNFTSVTLIVLISFSLISLIIPILEELEYKKLIKEFNFGEIAEEEREVEGDKYKKFFNKYQAIYKIQKNLSNVIKGASIALLIYYCVTLGPKFSM